MFLLGMNDGGSFFMNQATAVRQDYWLSALRQSRFGMPSRSEMVSGGRAS